MSFFDQIDLIDDETLHVKAVLDVLNAALEDPHKAWNLDDLDRETERPEEYLEVTVSRRASAENRRAAATSTSGWRIELRAVAHIRMNNARNMLRIARRALEFQCLTVGGKRSTAIQFESSEGVGPDDGWWSGDLVLTYAI